ncbi:MAG TPA: hypothetical protein VFC39_16075 [Acidobacteriaceae bacterium]|nr:hypothetical protein [Acidobacteriaceae bacterium]
MKFPAIKITFTSAELALMTPGLDFLDNGIANASLGTFPHRHPWDRIDSTRCSVFQNQEFDADMARKMIGAGVKLSSLSSKKKTASLDAFEIAAAAFALRLYKSLDKPPIGVDESTSLTRTLEMYRKRAKRGACRELGDDAYEAHALKWNNFLAWVRYNLTFFKVPMEHRFSQKRFAAEQRSVLAELIARTLRDRCFEALSASNMERYVRVLKEEFRRGRHPMTLRELLQGDQPSASELIFNLLKNKLTLTALPGDNIPRWQRLSESQERSRVAREARHQRGAEIGLSIAPITESESVVSIAETYGAPIETLPVKAVQLSSPRVPRANHVSIPEQELSMAIAQWLIDHVDTFKWPAVIEQAMHFISYGLCPPAKVYPCRTLGGLIRETHPSVESYEDCGNLADINFYPDWLLNWVTVLQGNPQKAYTAVQYGHGKALQLKAQTPRN